MELISNIVIDLYSNMLLYYIEGIDGMIILE